jgi:hypothetical protein
MKTQNFPKNYGWEVLKGLPGTGEILQFPIGGPRSFQEGYVVKIILSDDKHWIGNFQGMSRIGFSGVFSTLDPWIVCIVAREEGYLVDVNQPSNYQEVDAVGIQNVFTILDLGMLIFVTYTELVSYGSKGKVWETESFGNGEIFVTDVNKEGIYGKYWKPEINGYPEFYINPVTGECRLSDS